MIKESTIYGGLYWNIVKVRGFGIVLVENALEAVASILLKSRIDQEGGWRSCQEKERNLSRKNYPTSNLKRNE